MNYQYILPILFFLIFVTNGYAKVPILAYPYKILSEEGERESLKNGEAFSKDLEDTYYKKGVRLYVAIPESIRTKVKKILIYKDNNPTPIVALQPSFTNEDIKIKLGSQFETYLNQFISKTTVEKIGIDVTNPKLQQLQQGKFYEKCYR